MMEFREFENREELLRALADELRLALELASESEIPSIVVLAGGKTPYPAYAAVGDNPPEITDRLWLSMSDERHVPRDSEQNNHHNAEPFFEALGIARENLLPVPTELPTAQDAAETWAIQWQGLLERGVRIPLIILGIGEDGHTAGLFSNAHLQASEGKTVVAVDRPDNRQGISLTPEIFSRAKRILMLAPGEEKHLRVQDLKNNPLSLPAGKAVAGCPCVEVWF